MSYVFVLLFLCVYMFCGAWHGDIRLWVCAHAMVTFIIVDDHDYLFIYLFWLSFCYFTYFEARFLYIAVDVLELAT